MSKSASGGATTTPASNCRPRPPARPARPSPPPGSPASGRWSRRPRRRPTTHSCGDADSAITVGPIQPNVHHLPADPPRLIDQRHAISENDTPAARRSPPGSSFSPRPVGQLDHLLNTEPPTAPAPRPPTAVRAAGRHTSCAACSLCAMCKIACSSPNRSPCCIRQLHTILLQATTCPTCRGPDITTIDHTNWPSASCSNARFQTTPTAATTGCRRCASAAT